MPAVDLPSEHHVPYTRSNRPRYSRPSKTLFRPGPEKKKLRVANIKGIEDDVGDVDSMSTISKDVDKKSKREEKTEPYGTDKTVCSNHSSDRAEGHQLDVAHNNDDVQKSTKTHSSDADKDFGETGSDTEEIASKDEDPATPGVEEEEKQTFPVTNVDVFDSDNTKLNSKGGDDLYENNTNDEGSKSCNVEKYTSKQVEDSFRTKDEEKGSECDQFLTFVSSQHSLFPSPYVTRQVSVSSTSSATSSPPPPPPYYEALTSLPSSNSNEAGIKEQDIPPLLVDLSDATVNNFLLDEMNSSLQEAPSYTILSSSTLSSPLISPVTKTIVATALSISLDCSDADIKVQDNGTFLDDVCMDFDPRDISDGHLDNLDGYNFLWESLKEEESLAIPSSTASSTSSHTISTTNLEDFPTSTPTTATTTSNSASSSSPKASSTTHDLSPRRDPIPVTVDTSSTDNTIFTSGYQNHSPDTDSISTSVVRASPTTLTTIKTETSEETVSSSSAQPPPPPPPPPRPPSPVIPHIKQRAPPAYEDNCCPPDDVGAFFGHPLTRATSALNGEEVDTNASAVALLHEYINLPAIQGDDNVREGDKLNGFLDIINGQRSDPTLSTTDQNCSPSPISSNIEAVSSQSVHSPDASDSHHHHRVVHSSNNNSSNNSVQGSLHENGVVVGDDGPSSDDIVMPEYVNMFLQDNFRLEPYLLDGQTDGQPHPHADSNNNIDPNNNSNTDSNHTITTTISASITGTNAIANGDGSGVSLSQQQQQQQQLLQLQASDTVVVNVAEGSPARPRALKRSKSQREAKKATATEQKAGSRKTTARGVRGANGGNNPKASSGEFSVASATSSTPALVRTSTVTQIDKKRGGGGNWTPFKGVKQEQQQHQQQVVTSLPLNTCGSNGGGGVVCRPSHVSQEAGLVVLPTPSNDSVGGTINGNAHPVSQATNHLNLHQPNSLQTNLISHQHNNPNNQPHQQQQFPQHTTHILTPTRATSVSVGITSSDGVVVTSLPVSRPHEVLKTGNTPRPHLVIGNGVSGVHIANPAVPAISSPGVQQLQHVHRHQVPPHQHLLRRHTVPLSQSPQQPTQVVTLDSLSENGTNGNKNNIANKPSGIIIHRNQNCTNQQINLNNKIISTSLASSLKSEVHAGSTHSSEGDIIHSSIESTTPNGQIQVNSGSIVLQTDTSPQYVISTELPASYESLVNENKLLKQALSEKIRSRQQQQQQQHLQQQQIPHNPKTNQNNCQILQVDQTFVHLSPSSLSASPSSTSPQTPTPPASHQQAVPTLLIPSPSSSSSATLSSSVVSSLSSATPNAQTAPELAPSASPNSARAMPASHTLQFLTDDIPGMGGVGLASSSVKEECVVDSYVLDPSSTTSFDHQYATYGSDLAQTVVASLDNVCSGISNGMVSSCAAQVNGIVSGVRMSMASCDDVAVMQSPDQTSHSDNYNGVLGHIHQHHRLQPHHQQMQTVNNMQAHHQHQQQHHLHHQHANNNNTISTVQQEPMIVHTAGGQYFQVLQPLQSMEPNQQQHQQHQQQQQQQHSMQVSSTNNNNQSNGVANYYNYGYTQGSNPPVMETDKQVVVERYLHQQHQYTYSNSNSNNTNGYAHFLNVDNNYSMKSPDSGFQEPCLSPNSSTVAVPKDCQAGYVTEGGKEKTKKKKSAGSVSVGAASGGGNSGGALLVRQFSSSSTEKGPPKSPAIQKLEVNTTGYSYFLETPISTTQRMCEDRVTYLNKSQYYGLTLDFNNQDRIIKCSVVKSVIVLTFREEKPIEEERKAWEFWHGRQHSYKQRILDIDTKNCQGVLPQNIEEVSFNAVAVRWNPMDGPVRVNIAVHCLSTDFSNQKGVKGIPLHVQIDTYEQSPKDNHLVHRGYCQIKAFCDKGAERKTRDEERRKAAKGKVEEFTSAPVPVGSKNKGRKKHEETTFHEPCDRSEFYSMADLTTAPVFFNPLHESGEFLHKSLSLGVIPSQDEEISSLPTSLELPDSCDDFYNSTPPAAKRPRRDSSGNLKESPKVLLYVRERHETAYTALMLEIPTLHGLLRSIEQKYSIAPSKVKNFYKKSKKGILVKMDDNIIRHFSHESTFILEMNAISDDRDYEIILIEIEPVLS